MSNQGPQDWDDGSDYKPDSGPANPNLSGQSSSVPPPPPPSSSVPPPPPPAGSTPPPPPPPVYGQVPGQPVGYQPGPSQDAKSVGALATGILSILLSIFCALLSIPLGIAAIVLGVMGRKSLKAQGRGTGMATTGLVLGILSLLFALGWILIFAVGSTSS